MQTILMAALVSLSAASGLSDSAFNKRSHFQLVDYVDPICMGDCLQNCSTECTQVGSGRGECLRQCKRQNDDCRPSCLRAGDPPNPPVAPATGGSAPPCANTTTAMCGDNTCCAEPTPVCNPNFTGTKRCCPAQAPVAVKFLGVEFCRPRAP